MTPSSPQPPWPHGGPPSPPNPPWIGGGPPRRRSSVWNQIAIVLAIAVGVLGLLAVGAVVLMAISLNSYGSNK